MKRRLADDPPEINLIPMLDMISLLIQLLLINAQFGAYAEISTVMGAPSSDPQPGLQLRVDVSLTGFDVSWTTPDGPQRRSLSCASGSCLGPEGPDPTAYDTAGLAATAREIKGARPDEDQVQLMMSPEVPFEVMALAMDTLRGNEASALFPNVVMGSGGSK